MNERGDYIMMRQEIRLDTITDVQKFNRIVCQIEEDVTLKDDNGICINAKSFLGVLYALEFRHIYCYCSRDIAGLIVEWII